MTPALSAAGFAGVATGGRLYLQQLRNRLAPLARGEAVDDADG